MEYFDILDENGQKTGKKKLREEVHRDGDWHRTVHIWIINDKNEVLLQRRCKNKDSNPNMLDISSAGHLSAGDESREGAIRELKEELNLDIKKEDLEYIKTIKVEEGKGTNFINNEFNDIYLLKTNKKLSDMKYQEEEISEIMYIPYNEFKEMIKNHHPELLRHEEEFKILIELLDKKI